jgi:TfoX/Sxy family transcriptional regulator of competence genes
MKWQKSSQGLVDLFESVMPGPPAVRRKMFGYPAGFVNGKMFIGLFQESMILRLPTGPREEFLKLHNAKIFEPMAGRPMREYAAVPQSVMRDKKELTAWVARALEYGASLKPKPPAAKPTKSRSKPKKAKRPQK